MARFPFNFSRRTYLFIAAPPALYYTIQYLTPPPSHQPPHSPTKKNLIILGTGWAATSLLHKLNNENLNVTVISPRNYFLFTPLLPSCTTGTVECRSVMQPVREMARYMETEVKVIEGEAVKIDAKNKTIQVTDNSEIHGEAQTSTVNYDYLVVACGAENATFGVPGVKEYACFLKEIWDAKKIRSRLLDCLESASFPGQTEAEMDRLLNFVVVGGGPTGVEYAAELHDFLVEDLSKWYPELASKVKITLVEALPTVLGSFSKKLIKYTEDVFAANKVSILNNTSVKEVKEKEITIQKKDGTRETIPFGLIVWATGNTPRPLVKDLISQFPAELQTQRRGACVDDNFRALGSKDIFIVGDAAATKFAPTAQVATQQGQYLARVLEKAGETGDLESALAEVKPFAYEHWGSLAYIGTDKAIADLPGNIRVGGALTYLFWRSAYLSNLLTWRNRTLVTFDWLKMRIFGRDTSRE